METILTKLIAKISRYEIITNIVPGALLAYILTYIGYNIMLDNTILNIVVCYYVGIINNRFSSLCIEGIMKCAGWIEWREYEQYNRAKKERPFIASLQESANQYRAFSSVFLISVVAFGFSKLQETVPFFFEYGYVFVIFALFILFLLSYRKQVNNYIVKQIDEVNNKNV